MLNAAVTFRDGIGVDDLTWFAGLISVVAVIVGAAWALLKPLKRQADRIEAFPRLPRRRDLGGPVADPRRDLRLHLRSPQWQTRRFPASP